MNNLKQARENMIEQQIRPWDVLDQRVLDVLAQVPRDSFVAEEHRGLAYSDYQLPIGFGQTLFKPTIDGRLLQTLALKPTDSVLEIGTGSGYLTACLSRLTQHVDSIEIHPELHGKAKAHIDALGVTNVSLLVQDAAETWDSRDAYDAIAFGGAIEAIPDSYKHKMAIGGRLFAIIGDCRQPTMEAIQLTRLSETEWITDSLFETQVDPLINFSLTEQAFVF